jgi:hypothetical protein
LIRTPEKFYIWLKVPVNQANVERDKTKDFLSSMPRRELNIGAIATFVPI